MNKRAALISLFERLVRAASYDAARPEGPPTPCWEWPGARDAKGYGLIKVDGKCMRVYRVAWELATGRKLGKRTAEHTCRNPSCWRPSHIVPMSRAKNTAKGNRDNPRSTAAARAAQKRRAVADAAGADGSKAQPRAYPPSPAQSPTRD